MANPPDQTHPIRDLHGDPLPPGAVYRLGSVRLRHANMIVSVAFSQDGLLLASGDLAGVVCIWKTSTTQLLSRIKAHEERVYQVGFSPNSKLLASCGRDCTLRIWSTLDGREIIRKEHPRGGIFTAAFFSADSETLASYSPGDREVLVWGIESAGKLAQLGSIRSDQKPARMHGGEHILATRDTTLNVCEIASGRVQYTVEPQIADRPEFIAASPNAREIALYCSESVALIDGANGKKLSQLQAGRCTGYTEIPLCFSPNGRLLAAPGAEPNGSIQLWEVETRKPLFKLYGHDRAVNCIDFAPGGALLASVGDEQTIRLWDTESGRRVLATPGHERETERVVFSRIGRIMATGSWESAPVVWELPSCSPLWQFTGPGLKSLVGITPDGRILVSEIDLDDAHDVEERTICIWSAKSGEELHRRVGLLGVSVSLDGRVLGISKTKNQLSLWNLISDEKCWGLSIQGNDLVGVSVSPSGKLVALVSEKTPSGFGERTEAGSESSASVRRHRIQVWDIALDRMIREFECELSVIGSRVREPIFSTDDRYMAITCRNRVLVIFDLVGGRERLRGDSRVGAKIAFSPDSRVIAATSDVGEIAVWDIAKGSKYVMRGVGGVISPRCVCFSPNGLIIAGGYYSGEIGIWRYTDNARSVLVGHVGGVADLAFSPDGRLLASASADTTVLVWDVEAVLKKGG